MMSADSVSTNDAMGFSALHVPVSAGFVRCTSVTVPAAVGATYTTCSCAPSRDRYTHGSVPFPTCTGSSHLPSRTRAASVPSSSSSSTSSAAGAHRQSVIPIHTREKGFVFVSCDGRVVMCERRCLVSRRWPRGVPMSALSRRWEPRRWQRALARARARVLQAQRCARTRWATRAQAPGCRQPGWQEQQKQKQSREQVQECL